MTQIDGPSSQQAELVPDAPTIRAHLTAILGSLDEGIIGIVGLHRTPGEVSESERVRIRRVAANDPEAISKLTNAAYALNTQYNVYIEPAARRPGVDQGRGGDADCIAVACWWADIDVRSDRHPKATAETLDEAIAALRGSPLPPTLVVATGGGAQGWWVAAEPMTASEYGPTVEPWSEYWTSVGGDNVANISHLMRLAGTINHKHGTVATIVEHRPERLYGPLQILDDMPVVVLTPEQQATVSTLMRDDSTGGEGDTRPPDPAEGPRGWLNSRIDLFARQLEHDGWTLGRPRSMQIADAQGALCTYEKWFPTRPGKDDRSTSATLNRLGHGRLYIYSSSVEIAARNYRPESPLVTTPRGQLTGELVSLTSWRNYTFFEYLRLAHFNGNENEIHLFAAELFTKYATEAERLAVELRHEERRDERAATSGRKRVVLVTPDLEYVAIEEIRQGIQERAQEFDLYADEAGRLIDDTFTPQTAKHMRAYVSAMIQFERINAKGDTTLAPIGRDWLETLAALRYDVPVLRGIARNPIILQNGNIRTDNGYEPTLGLLQDTSLVLDVPEHPTADEVRAARDLVWEVWSQFPFASQRDVAHWWAAILAACCRPMFDTTPLWVVSAHSPGTGKSLMVSVLSLLAHGEPPSASARPRRDEEFEKVIRSALIERRNLLLVDEMGSAPWESSDLNICATDRKISVRRLGTSDSHSISTTERIIVLAGNNVALSGDQARRCLVVNLTNRDTTLRYRHADLQRYVTEHRSAILSAVYTLIRGWVQAGRPETDVETAGAASLGFHRAVGGILGWIGVEGYSVANAIEAATVIDEQIDLRAAIGDAVTRYAPGDQPGESKWLLAREIINIDLAQDRDFQEWITAAALLHNSKTDQRASAFGGWLASQAGRVDLAADWMIEKRRIKAGYNQYRFKCLVERVRTPLTPLTPPHPVEVEDQHTLWPEAAPVEHEVETPLTNLSPTIHLERSLNPLVEDPEDDGRQDDEQSTTDGEDQPWWK